MRFWTIDDFRLTNYETTRAAALRMIWDVSKDSVTLTDCCGEATNSSVSSSSWIEYFRRPRRPTTPPHRRMRLQKGQEWQTVRAYTRPLYRETDRENPTRSIRLTAHLNLATYDFLTPFVDGRWSKSLSSMSSFSRKSVGWSELRHKLIYEDTDEGRPAWVHHSDSNKARLCINYLDKCKLINSRYESHFYQNTYLETSSKMDQKSWSYVKQTEEMKQSSSIHR